MIYQKRGYLNFQYGGPKNCKKSRKSISFIGIGFSDTRKVNFRCKFLNTDVPEFFGFLTWWTQTLWGLIPVHFFGFQAQQKRIWDANFYFMTLKYFSVFQYGGPEKLENTWKSFFCIRCGFLSSTITNLRCKFLFIDLKIFFGFPIWRTRKFGIHLKIIFSH